MEENILNTLEADDTLKAFALSMLRIAVAYPNLLLHLANKANPLAKEGLEWVYELVKDSEDVRRSLLEKANSAANDYSWSRVEEAYIQWGKYGWVADNTYVKFGLWDSCPASQVEADRLILKQLSPSHVNSEIKTIRELLLKKHRPRYLLNMFEEACTCFEEKCYTACASLLISLIDRELIQSRANTNQPNKKTGVHAGTRVSKAVLSDENYGLPGLFHLEFLSFKSYIDVLFENAHGFKNEPPCLNRNFLHHGLSKRKVLKKDCIKLFLAYKNTFKYIHHN